MSKPNLREKRRQFLRVQRELKKKQKTRIPLNDGEGMEKGECQKASSGAF